MTRGQPDHMKNYARAMFTPNANAMGRLRSRVEQRRSFFEIILAVH
jgi:hypothetical protein